MPQELSPGKPNTRRYSEAEKGSSSRYVSEQLSIRGCTPLPAHCAGRQHTLGTSYVGPVASEEYPG